MAYQKPSSLAQIWGYAEIEEGYVLFAGTESVFDRDRVEEVSLDKICPECGTEAFRIVLPDDFPSIVEHPMVAVCSGTEERMAWLGAVFDDE